MKELNEEKKNCTNERSIEIMEEQKELTEEYQRNTLENVGAVYTPGWGTTAGLAICIGSLLLF
ncbi:MAG: hypothetical protein WDA09_00195 [Bacteriovoracaceae bacterium]